jgi:DNA-binding winged helix-turn-helix (wHTH) protein
MADDIYRFGDFSLSPRERRLFRGDDYLNLSPKAFDALSLLVRNHGNLVSRSELFSALWPGIHVGEANLTNIVVTLRKMLGREAVQTVSKSGYRFTIPVTGEPGIHPEGYASFIRKGTACQAVPGVDSGGAGAILVLYSAYPAIRSRLGLAGAGVPPGGKIQRSAGRSGFGRSRVSEGVRPRSRPGMRAPVLYKSGS